MEIMDINEIKNVTSSDISVCDQKYENKVLEAAKEIYAQRDRVGVILLSGPSGSSKTGTALLLESKLDAMGVETHTVSMDDYFSPFTPEERLLDKDGKLDYESPSRLDADLLTAQIEDMIACRPVYLPIYNFIDSSRTYRKEPLARKQGEIILMEGIHALNPAVVKANPDRLINVYVSVDTAIAYEGGMLTPDRIRLVRRILRDRKKRGRSMEETIRMFENVEIGSKKNVEPYRYRADYQFDSFKKYELPVYKYILGDELQDIPVREIRDTLAQLPAIDPENVPSGSMTREFIGS